jgi:DNA (cytosine-5)-methyltransferase 1
MTATVAKVVKGHARLQFVLFQKYMPPLTVLDKWTRGVHLSIHTRYGVHHHAGSKMKHDHHQPTMIDLFAGCGGLSLGMEQAGFRPLFVNELSPDAMETYLINRDHDHPHLRRKFHAFDVKQCVNTEGFIDDLLDGLNQEFNRNFRTENVDLLTGGPPCQGFSGIGIRRSYSVEKVQQPSNHLFQDMAYFVHKIRPKIFLFENVEGLLRGRWTNEGSKGEIFRDVLDTFKNIPGYQVRSKLVYGKDYRIPQNRPRILIVGVREDLLTTNPTSDDAVLAGFLPPPVGMYPHIEDLLSDLVDPHVGLERVTSFYPSETMNELQEWLRYDPIQKLTYRKGDPLTEHSYSKHAPHVVERFQHMVDFGTIPVHLQTKKFAQRVLPRRWGNQGPNITACSLPDDFVHYEQPRSLTVREWARLQTFPDWYRFAGKRTTGGIRRAGNPRESIFDREVPKYTQIGNAVAVRMATEIGKHFLKILRSS